MLLLHTSEGRYAPCTLHLCHSIGLQRPFSTLWAPTRPVASISIGLQPHFRCFVPQLDPRYWVTQQ